MFFIAGVSNKQEKLDFNQTIICSKCGKYGRCEVLIEYMYLSLFFIPIFKWNKKFYVVSTCCGTTYLLNKEVGDCIYRGENVTINEEDLQILNQGEFYHLKRCSNCGFETEENFQYCPKCGSQFNR